MFEQNINLKGFEVKFNPEVSYLERLEDNLLSVQLSTNVKEKVAAKRNFIKAINRRYRAIQESPGVYSYE